MNVILGGGYAGLLCALKLKAAGQPVLLVNGSDQFVERVRLHQLAAGQQLQSWSLAQVLGSDFLQGWVTAIDTQSRQVEVTTSEGIRRLEYQQLVLALGSFTDVAQLPGAAEHCYTLDGESAARFAERLPSCRRVLVIGAGLTGLELATELAEQHPHLEVTLADRSQPGAAMSARAATYLRSVLSRLNIRVVTTALTEVQAGRAGGLEFDAAVFCGGFRACPLAAEAGLEVNARGQVLVDPYLRVRNDPKVWVIGDAACPPGPNRMACATALPMGELTARNLIALSRGQQLKPLRYQFQGRCLSLGRQRGLLELTRGDDSPLPLYLWGGLGARIKEFIVAGIALGSLKRAAR
jgi:NADH dehydrogenase